MIFVELTTAKGNLDPEQRLRVAQRLGSMHELSGGAEVQPGTAEVFRSMFQVVIHEPEAWAVGEEPVAPADPPRYVVRAYVPAPWRKDLSQPLIAHVTKVLSELGADDDGAEPGRGPAVLVLVLGISEGAIGLDGVPRTSTDLVEMLGELRAGIVAQLVGEYLPVRRVGGQRLGLPAVGVQCPDQQPAQPFPQRVRRGELLQFGYRRPYGVGRQFRRESVLDGHQPQFLGPRDHRPGVPGLRHVRQRIAPPQLQRLP